MPGPLANTGVEPPATNNSSATAILMVILCISFLPSGNGLGSCNPFTSKRIAVFREVLEKSL